MAAASRCPTGRPVEIPTCQVDQVLDPRAGAPALVDLGVGVELDPGEDEKVISAKVLCRACFAGSLNAILRLEGLRTMGTVVQIRILMGFASVVHP